MQRELHQLQCQERPCPLSLIDEHQEFGKVYALAVHEMDTKFFDGHKVTYGQRF